MIINGERLELISTPELKEIEKKIALELNERRNERAKELTQYVKALIDDFCTTENAQFLGNLDIMDNETGEIMNWIGNEEG